MQTIRIHSVHDYPVHIGPGLIGEAGPMLHGLFPAARVCVIADDNTARLFASPLTQSLRGSGIDLDLVSFPHGEQNKNLSVLGSLLGFCAEKQFTRGDVIVALGGGVVGDMAGLCAALYQRGVSCVQIPTTLLAAVDSSVGGKTAVDLPQGKNLAGAFWPPRAVICDTDILAALPDGLLRDGTGEILKYGLLCDEALFDLAAGGGIRSQMEKTVARCVAIKREYVEADEHDNGVRRMLNLGHTFGHAVESCSGFTLSHGQAVGLGLYMASRAAGLPEAERVRAALIRCGLPVRCPYSAAELAQCALRDKKRGADGVTFIFPDRIGHCRTEKIGLDRLEDVFEKALASDTDKM